MADNSGADGFAPLRVKRVVRETSDAVSLVLDVPERCSARYRYQAGQFLTLRVTVDGQKQREGTVPAGERLQLHADRAIVIRAGNGADVVVKTATGENPLGAAGQPITFTFTKAGGGKQ